VSTEFNAHGVAKRLGAAQRRTILSLGENLGNAADHRCASRMFHNVRSGNILVLHGFLGGNSWCLTPKGLLVKSALEAME
jgi:hypothetical protein